MEMLQMQLNFSETSARNVQMYKTQLFLQMLQITAETTARTDGDVANAELISETSARTDAKFKKYSYCY
jgi:hypothetical protein